MCHTRLLGQTISARTRTSTTCCTLPPSSPLPPSPHSQVFPTADYAFVWDANHTLKCGVTGCLFNLTADPAEQQDLAPSRPDLLQQMTARLHEEMAKKYEHDGGKTDKLGFLLELERRNGFVGPFAK